MRHLRHLTTQDGSPNKIDSLKNLSDRIREYQVDHTYHRLQEILAVTEEIEEHGVNAEIRELDYYKDAVRFQERVAAIDKQLTAAHQNTVRPLNDRVNQTARDDIARLGRSEPPSSTKAAQR